MALRTDRIKGQLITPEEHNEVSAAVIALQSAVLTDINGPHKKLTASYDMVAADHGGMLQYDTGSNPGTFKLPPGVAPGWTVTCSQSWTGPLTVSATDSAGSLLRRPGTDQEVIRFEEGDAYRFILRVDSRWQVWYLAGTARQRDTGVRIKHGSDANYPRPEAVGWVRWEGTVEPTNMQIGDEWVDIS